MLKLMYITNRPEVAKIAEEVGVDRIFIDMEYIGKEKRQGGMDTVQCHYTLDDIANVKKVLVNAKIVARVNPIHDATQEYSSSEEEIDGAIKNGADIIMLPFFKTVEEVDRFLRCVGGRAKTMLLLETPEAVSVLDDILKLKGIDEIHIGINDLSLGYGKKFMFELLSDGTVELICNKIKASGITTYGFGGIASLGRGIIPAEKIILEHYRLGSSLAILSRSFCNANTIDDMDIIKRIFYDGVRLIREFERRCKAKEFDFEENKKQIAKIVEKTVKEGL